MKSFLGRYNYFLLFILIFACAEVIVNPLGDFPLNDDWTYGKAVDSTITDTYSIGHFGAMTLFTHLMWGIFFVKIFGFSFTVLRLSTLVSVIIGMFFLDRLVFKITANKLTAFFACLVLLFNPMYFNLSNTYMTDVNFNTLFILYCYYAFRFFERNRIIYAIVIFTLSVLLVLLRQFGIILPVCFSLACLFVEKRRVFWFTFSLLGIGLTYYSLAMYESFLKGILYDASAYKYSGTIHLSDPDFWNMFSENFRNRYQILLLQIGVYVAPFAAIYISGIVKHIRKPVVALMILVNAVFAWWFFRDAEFPFRNIFENMSLGPETFFESLQAAVPHTYSGAFERPLLIAKYFLSTLTLTALSWFVLSFFKDTKRAWRISAETVFLVAFSGSYAFMIFITESYFDRYHILLITAGVITLAWIGKNLKADYKASVLILLVFFYVAVFGTKDYLTWNRIRWEAFYYLKETKQVSPQKINGGFEVNCWVGTGGNWLHDYTSLEKFDYLIQFKNEPGFKLHKAFEFQRYFPYKKDKINIFEKEPEN